MYIVNTAQVVPELTALLAVMLPVTRTTFSATASTHLMGSYRHAAMSNRSSLKKPSCTMRIWPGGYSEAILACGSGRRNGEGVAAMPDNVIPFWRKMAERAQAEEAKRAQVFEQMDVALVLIGILAGTIKAMRDTGATPRQVASVLRYAAGELEDTGEWAD
jgi:hypothetical protein